MVELLTDILVFIATWDMRPKKKKLVGSFWTKPDIQSNIETRFAHSLSKLLVEFGMIMRITWSYSIYIELRLFTCIRTFTLSASLSGHPYIACIKQIRFKSSLPLWNQPVKVPKGQGIFARTHGVLW